MERYSNFYFADFDLEFLSLLGKHASVKKRYIRANQKNFMDKELNQAIMVRYKLRNKFLKLKTVENRLAYAKQLNYCVKLFQQKKRQYFENLNFNSITDNKLFWKTVSPLFTEKNGSKSNKITLVEGGKVLTDDTKIAETFNSFFGNIVNTLNIEFSFVPVDKDVIAKEIKNFNAKEAAAQDDIPVKILKLTNDIFSQYLSEIFVKVLKRPISHTN